LIVDDEPCVRQVLQLYCERLGLRTLIAGSAEEAVEIYTHHREEVRLLLLDVNMPECDGPGTLSRLRSVGLHCRVCFMSGETGRYSVEGLLALGAERFFEKPFPFDRFGSELLALVGDSRAAVA
jgi:CheY-like chemotaxis protein